MPNLHRIPLDALQHVLVRFQDATNGSEIEGFGILPLSTWLTKRALVIAKATTITYIIGSGDILTLTYANGLAAIAKFTVVEVSQPEIAVILKAFGSSLTSDTTFYAHAHFPLDAFAA